MASFVGHLLTAQTYTTQALPNGSFLSGVLFPDIRSITNVGNTALHTDIVPMELLNHQSFTFVSGLLLHSWLDNERKHHYEQWLPDYLTAQSLHEPSDVLQTLKLLEDEIYYSQLKDVRRLIAKLDPINPEEMFFNFPTKDIKKWHKIVGTYLAEAPTNESRRQLIISFGRSPKVATRRNKLLAEMRQDQALVAHIKAAYKQMLHDLSTAATIRTDKSILLSKR